MLKKAIAELKNRWDNFHDSSKIHENRETSLLLDFCRLQYCSVDLDIPHIKLRTQNMLTWIPTHTFFDKNVINQSTGVKAS